MPELPTFSAGVETALRVALIVVATLITYVAFRTGVSVSVRHLLERRASEADAGKLPPLEMERRISTIARLVVRVGATVLVVVGVLMAFGEFGIDIGPAVAGLGVVGIAVGFGAQALIRDWLAGIFIVIENQYSAGDVVRIADVQAERGRRLIADWCQGRPAMLRSVDVSAERRLRWRADVALLSPSGRCIGDP
ncbi:hypothetical protein BH23CHL10_BH23CHL10_06500 [soil metagenome]